MAVTRITMSAPRAPEPEPSAASVEISGVSFAYPRHGHHLADVSLAIYETEVCCLLGPNGAGKTTLLRCLLKLLSPHRGTIRVYGTDIGTLSARKLARLVAYVPQSTAIPFPFTALDIAIMGRTPHLAPYASPSVADRRVAFGHLERLGIDHLAGHIFSKLSGGERQLVLLARALVQEAPVLVLDEPTAALDYGNEVRLLQIVSDLARAGRSVFMITHQPAHALSYASRVVLMRDGVVIANGKPADIVTSERLTDLYGVPIHVAAVPFPGAPAGEVRTCVAIPSRTA
jgi:iron complex transport system ATP-binding protein